MCALFHARRHPLFIVFSALAGLYLASSQATAQKTLKEALGDDLRICIQDTACLYRFISSGDSLHHHFDTLPAGWYAPSYEFIMNYDSVCTVDYLFSECKLNGELWKLARWWYHRSINTDAPVLGFNSRTIPATLHAGDSVTFFRYLRWFEPLTSLQDTNNYYALDTLGYSVELVRASDSTRLILLDSLGIQANTVPDRPRIHGSNGLIAVVSYHVPAAYDGVQAFLRVRPWHSGSGPYWFVRSDGITVGVSNWLSDTNFTRYLRLYDPPIAKYAPGDLRATATDSHILAVVADPADRSRVAITFNSSPDGHGTTVAIYDALGNLVFVPYLTATSRDREQITYSFPQSGSYFVALFHNARLVATRIVQISR